MAKTVLMTVEEIFELSDRLVLAPGVDSSMASYLKPKSVIEFIRPDKSSFTTNIIGLELLAPNSKRIYPVAISKQIGKGNIPVGTQIWTVDDEC